MSEGRRQFTAVVWDLDGTLLDTETLSSQALQQVLDPFSKLEDWELKKKLLGRRAPDWCEIAISERDLVGKITPDEMHAQWESNLSALCPQVNKCSGAISCTEYFDSVGAPQAIATSSTAPAVVLKREKHEDIFSKMKLVVTGDQVDNGKPAPDIYQHAASLLGVQGTDCLAFEDSLAGVRSAVAAGMTCFAVVDERFEESELACFQECAYKVVRSLDEALVVIREEFEYVSAK
jgi:beta-phosphoglucomutase-like phosphatase (HAD superfamily)